MKEEGTEREEVAKKKEEKKKKPSTPADGEIHENEKELNIICEYLYLHYFCFDM